MERPRTLLADAEVEAPAEVLRAAGRGSPLHLPWEFSSHLGLAGGYLTPSHQDPSSFGWSRGSASTSCLPPRKSFPSENTLFQQPQRADPNAAGGRVLAAS